MPGVGGGGGGMGPAETLFQFSDSAYTPPPRDPYAHQRGRDNFGTLRSHQGLRDPRAAGVGVGGPHGDGFGTTRSVKKVRLISIFFFF